MQKHFDIELKNVKVSLPGGKTLFAIQHFKAVHGSHILIQGKSGQGKTTFLHLLAGLLTADDGEVLVGEKEMRNLSDAERCELRRQNIGVIFQKLNLLDHLTAEENIQLSSVYTEEALKRVDMQAKAKELCSVMSLGEQQRVAVARVLAQNVDIILADEPTSSLDAINAQFVMSALKEKAKGKTLIVVSHDERISSFFDKTLQFSEIHQ